MAQYKTLEEFVSATHQLYQRYFGDWQLAYKSYIGGVEYRHGKYLRAYETDTETASETIKTYDIDSNGAVLGQHKSYINYAKSGAEADRGLGDYEGTFYYEKLLNTPLFPYVRLYCSEWNAMLFNSPPHRDLPERSDIKQFLQNADGEGNSINEFMSHLDLLTSVFGVMWVSCVKFTDSEYPLFKMHTPLEVLNWEYAYDGAGNLVLKKLLIQLSDDESATVYRYFTPQTIETIYLSKTDDVDFNIETDLEIIDDGDMLRTVTENELGYIPCIPVYQGTKIYNGIGHTPTFDIAQIQRSIYGDFGELYSAITYGSHPVNLVDENTSELNDGKVSAEPGSVLRVPGSVGGTPQYVYEFKAPPMQGVEQISKLVDQKIEKMNQIAMIRSDDLIKASRSGVQIEQYDSKLESFVRRKAVALENAEYNLWRIWFDWINVELPEDFSVSYNRQYGKRAISYEIDEINNMLMLYDQFKSRFGHEGIEQYEDAEVYATVEQAKARAVELGGSGYHEHEEDGVMIYMPFASHEQLQQALMREYGVEEDSDHEEIKEGLKKRIQQLLNGSYSENSL